MAIETKYVCDICGAESHEYNNYHEVNVTRKWLGSSFPQAVPQYRVLLCTQCTNRLHLTHPNKKDEEANQRPPAPSLEDLLRELIRDELEQQQ